MSERQPVMEVEGTNPDWTNPLNHHFAGPGGGGNKIRKNKSKCDELMETLGPEYRTVALGRQVVKMSYKRMFVKTRIYDYLKGQGGEFYVMRNDGVPQVCKEELALQKMMQKMRDRKKKSDGASNDAAKAKSKQNKESQGKQQQKNEESCVGGEKRNEVLKMLMMKIRDRRGKPKQIRDRKKTRTTTKAKIKKSMKVIRVPIPPSVSLKKHDEGSSGGS